MTRPTEPEGAMYVRRRKSGDTATRKDSDGVWRPVEPPERKPGTQDGSAEYWEPLPSEKDEKR